MEFSKPYLHKEGHATLFVEDGTTWDVDLKINYYGQLTFSTGWKKFSLDNKLKVGDVCAFELDESSGFSFKVTIYPLDKEENSSTPLFKGIIYLLAIYSLLLLISYYIIPIFHLPSSQEVIYLLLVK